MKHVSIEIIRECPNNCKYCSSESGRGCNEIIDVHKVKEVFDGLEKMKVEEVSLSGGEPFLHKDLVEIVKYGKDKGFRINIYTSGIMFDENKKDISLDENILNKLSNVKVNKLIFNMQSLNEDVYNKIMGTKGNLSLLKKSIKDTKKRGIYTELHFVPMKLNYMEIQDVVDYVNKQEVDKVSFLGLIPHGRANINRAELFLDKNTNLKVKKLLHKLECEKVRVGTPLQLEEAECTCTAGRDKLYIKFDGKVYGCEAFKYIQLFNKNNTEINPDSIFERNIKDIFDNSQYLKAAEIKIKSIFENDNVHEKCPRQEEIREMEK